MRVAVGLSGGADSVALTRALAASAPAMGIVVHAAHLHHGLRGAEADQDEQFAARMADRLQLPFHVFHVDTAIEAQANPDAAKSRETIEEAARRLRYGWFRELMAAQNLDAVATAHTLDDQAETVLGKLLRGAWTEGLSGIHPVVRFPEGAILRPLLHATRQQVEGYLTHLGQAWRNDSSNQDVAYSRNRLRHRLLPELESWNPQIREHLANLAELARDEESFWAAETARAAAQIVMTGRPVRGGGRAAETGATISLDVVRLAAQSTAMQRRLLRSAAQQFRISLAFEATEALRAFALTGRAGQKLALPGPLTAERTPREIRISPAREGKRTTPSTSVHLPVPGECVAFGLQFRAQTADMSGGETEMAVVRNWRPGDRVVLRHSSGPRKVKEVLERMKVTGSDRLEWPVVEWRGQVVWMKGIELQPDPSLRLSVQAIS